MRLRFRWIAAFCFFFAFVVQRQGLAKETAEWTFLVYANYDNENAEVVGSFINDLRNAPSERRINVVLQLDLPQSPTHRYLVKDSKLLDLGAVANVDSGDAKTLLEFLVWGANEFPAEHYFVSMVGPGMLYKFSYDKSSGSMIELRDLGKALQSFSKHLLKRAHPVNRVTPQIDVFNVSTPNYGFSSGWSLGLALATELKDSVKILIGPTENMGTDGLYGLHSTFFKQLAMQPKSLRALAENIIGSLFFEKPPLPYSRQNYAAIDLRQIGRVSPLLNKALGKTLEVAKSDPDVRNCIIPVLKDYFTDDVPYRFWDSYLERLVARLSQCVSRDQESVQAFRRLSLLLGSEEDTALLKGNKDNRIEILRRNPGKILFRFPNGHPTQATLRESGHDEYRASIPLADGKVRLQYTVLNELGVSGRIASLREATTYLSVVTDGHIQDIYRGSYPEHAPSVASFRMVNHHFGYSISSGIAFVFGKEMMDSSIAKEVPALLDAYELVK